MTRPRFTIDLLHPRWSPIDRAAWGGQPIDAHSPDVTRRTHSPAAIAHRTALTRRSPVQPHSGSSHRPNRTAPTGLITEWLYPQG